MSSNATTPSTITYEEIMGLKNTSVSSLSNNATAEASAAAVVALSNRLVTFRKWLTDEAKVSMHSAVCIVNGEATDGTRNAPVMVVERPSNTSASSTSGVVTGAGESSATVIDNTALNGRIGTVDGEGDISLYDRTMGCCVRAVRELKPNEVILTIPRSAMVTPDLVAASDAGRAILACCKFNKTDLASTNSLGAQEENAVKQLGFWDAFENTTLCESKFSPRIARTSGPQVLVKILQERKKADAAYKKSLKKLSSSTTNDSYPNTTAAATSNNTSNNPISVELDDDEKQYRLAEYGTISTRAPFLAFLIHQRFYNAVRPLVVSSKSDIDDFYDDDDDDGTHENEFQVARDSDDGNALSAIDTLGGRMISFPPGAAETFAPYARTLPSSVSIPLCWKRNELALLANCIPGAPLLHEVATTTLQLVAEFTAILDAGITSRFPKTFPEGLLTWDRWVWAAAVFTSRILPASCYIDEGDGKAVNFHPSHEMEFQSPPHIWDELGVMVPLLDMLNHEIDEHQVTFQPCIPRKDKVNDTISGDNELSYNSDTETITRSPHPPRAILHKKVKKGSELYCCYGNLTTTNLILQYGFAQLNGNIDEVRMGWALPDAVGNVCHPSDFTPNFSIEKDLVFESNNEKEVSSWWTEERIKLLEREAFPTAETSFLANLRASKKMTAAAYSDGTFHPILLTAAVIATMPESHVRKFTKTKDEKETKVIISKRHQRIIQRYLQFMFTRKLEKLLQNLDYGLKDHFGNISLWTKASDGGVRYVKEEEATGNRIGWQTFFDSHAYKAAIEVEKKYYAMGSDSCVLALYDGQVRALQISVDHISDDQKFCKGVIKQLLDLGFEVSNEELDVTSEEIEMDEEKQEIKVKQEVNVKQEANGTVREIQPKVTAEISSERDMKIEPEGKGETNTEAATTASNESKPKENGKSSNGSKSPRNRRRNRKKAVSTEKPPAVKLHIGNLSYSTTPPNLYNYFSSIYGQDNVLECHIPTERDSGKSRGFGFVAMPEAVAKLVLQSRQKHEVDGRLLKIARSNSAGSASTSKPSEGPPPPASGRCATCGYRPKYCTCSAPNLPGFDRYPIGLHPRGPPPPPGPVYEHHIDNYGREPPRDYGYFGGPGVGRYRDGPMRDFYEPDDRFRDYDRDRRSYEYRYEEFYDRAYDRDDEYYRDGGRKNRGRDRSRDRSTGSRSSSRRRDHDECRGSRDRDESRGSRRAKKECIDEWDHSRKRSPERKERSKKKKSKRRRSRSRSSSPP